MKRMLVGVLAVLIVFSAMCSVVIAEETDFSQMDFDELVAMQTVLEAELRSRPEASPFILQSGVYIVGVDIKPGQYYVAISAIDSSSATLNIFPTVETFEQRWVVGGNGGAIISCFLGVRDKAEHIELAEGNYIEIFNAPVKFSIFEFDDDDYCKYIPPEGVEVPAGTYIVGEDIPAGTYRVYPASLKWGDIWVYDNASVDNQCIDREDVNQIDGSYRTIKIDDGNMVEIEVDVIMNKQPVLTFD